MVVRACPEEQRRTARALALEGVDGRDVGVGGRGEGMGGRVEGSGRVGEDVVAAAEGVGVKKGGGEVDDGRWTRRVE